MTVLHCPHVAGLGTGPRRWHHCVHTDYCRKALEDGHPPTSCVTCERCTDNRLEHVCSNYCGTFEGMPSCSRKVSSTFTFHVPPLQPCDGSTWLAVMYQGSRRCPGCTECAHVARGIG